MQVGVISSVHHVIVTFLQADNEISWEEVKEHKSKSKGVWVAIHNKVYNVTQFMDDVSL